MKTKLILPILMLGGLQTMGQTVDYPCKKLIETSNYAKAESTLEKELSKKPDDVTMNFAAYKMFANKNFSKYDIKTAYDYLSKSFSSFETLSSNEKANLKKSGFSKRMFDNELDRICKPAMNSAKAENTISAYKAFISNYPLAKEVVQAWNCIYKLDFDAATSLKTDSAYRAHLSQYPKSPYAEKAQALLDMVDFMKTKQIGGFEAFKQFIDNNPDKPELVAMAQDSICKILANDPKRENIEYALSNFKGRQKDEVLRIYHDVYAENGTWDFGKVWTMAGNSLQDLKKHDNKIYMAYSEVGNEEFIKLAAPYRCAYNNLLLLIKNDIKAKKFDAALATVRKFKSYFGDSKDYNSLLQTLERPIDNTIIINAFGPSINTKDGYEYDPIISADGKKLLFCGFKRENNIGGEDIFISENKGGVWQKAKLFPDINTKDGNESAEALSVSANQLIMYHDGMLYQTNKTKSGWSNPEKLNENINFCDWQTDPTISSDGNVMIFAARSSNDYEYLTSINIFVSIKDENGEWGPAFDIGRNINTPMDDRSPVLHPDMKTLYFCSGGHGNLGDMDIFVSTRLREDSWTEWSEPINLGKEFNTENDESFFKISTDGNTAYFSMRTNDNEDLYYSAIPNRIKPNPVATIYGTLTDINNKPISAPIYWEDLETHELIGQSETDPADGSYFIVLPEGKNYGYFINDNKYFPTSSNIDLRNKHEAIKIENNIKAVSITDMVEKQIPIVLNNLFFNTAEYELLPSSITELQRVFKILTERDLKVEISGHTDNVGDDQYNQELSENRANSVKQYLMELGYPESKLTTIGYGKKKPVASNSTAEGRQKNRRVEMRVIR